MEAKLIVVGGDVKASEIKLKLPTIIGRGKGATLLLQHPLVSRQHCEIYEDGGQLVVRDMGSLNGTYVNNSRLTEPTFLPSGDLLTIGDVTFRAEYTSDPNMAPPGGPKTAHIGGFPTSQATKSPKDAVPDFSASDDEEEVDFGSVEVVEDEAEDDAPQVRSFDEIPAISASDGDFNPMAFLDDEEDDAPAVKPAPAKAAPAPKAPAAKTPAKPEAKQPAKAPEAKKPAKPTSAAPAKGGGSSEAATPTGGKPGSRWVVPGASGNSGGETLRAPSKPKAAGGKPAAPKIEAPPEAAAKPKDEAADFLASLGMSAEPNAAPAEEVEAFPDFAEPPPPEATPAPAETDDFLSNLGLDDAPAASPTPTMDDSDVAEVEAVEEVEVEEVDAVEIEDVAEVEDVEEVAISPPNPVAKAASAVASPLTVEETPAVEDPVGASDDDVESFLSGLADEPVAEVNAQDVAESDVDDIEEVEVAEVEVEEPEVEEVDVEAVEVADEMTEPEPAPPAPAAPVAIQPAASPAPVAKPAAPAAPAKRPHATPVPFAMPYTPARPAAPAAPAATNGPAPTAPAPARKPHAAPRVVPGPAVPPPGKPASPGAKDDGLSDFLKNFGK